MLGDLQTGDLSGMPNRTVYGACGLGSLGRVLGHVRGDSLIAQFAQFGRDVDRSYVELIAPPDGRGRSVLYSDRDLTGGLAYGPVEQVDRDVVRRAVGWSVRSVEPDDGMEVDQAASLILGDLGV
ncbi:hypothetical protein GCM10010404_61240 [Nonomuraea africana]|uniref:Uncharacterized protein n=1 Tax=Nonomuraea africana TaxID=46171 RepID=A0ABR9KSF4_9ACTN|nr:hypothetical protein [Nonomuraea africana]MBE1564952.1 hypothetical protein [Nonomuraea africana]